MAYISGRWLFNSNIEWWGTLPTDTSLEVNFKTYNIECYKMVFIEKRIDYYVRDIGYITVYDNTNGWVDDVYRTVDFEAPQGVSEEQQNLIEFNATLIEEYNPYYIISEKTLTNIADAIRIKNGTLTKYKPTEMDDAILALNANGITPTGTLVINENGTYNVTNYETAEVNIASSGGGGSGEGFWDADTIKAVLDRSITAVTIPEGTTTIGNHAFAYCGSLKSVSLPNSLTTIGANAFTYCEDLVLTSLPENITTIGGYAFSFCYSLATLTFKGTPTSIHKYAFSNCTDLTTINVPWAAGAVANAPWGADNAVINYNYTGE